MSYGMKKTASRPQTTPAAPAFLTETLDEPEPAQRRPPKVLPKTITINASRSTVLSQSDRQLKPLASSSSVPVLPSSPSKTPLPPVPACRPTVGDGAASSASHPSLQQSLQKSMDNDRIELHARAVKTHLEAKPLANERVEDTQLGVARNPPISTAPRNRSSQRTHRCLAEQRRAQAGVTH